MFLSLAAIAPIAALVFASCGGGDDDDDKPKMMEGQKCQGGESFSCRSRSGCNGHQFCTSAGVLGACVCDTPGSSGGSGGGSGSGSAATDGGMHDDGGAAAGSSGGGSSGGGKGGSAGNGGSSGAGGSAGSAGQDAGTAADAGHPQTGDEDCDNGSDDDGDGKVDCADDDCGTRSCLPAAPDGWTGPTVVRIGTNLPGQCQGDYDSEVARGGTAVSAPAATCSACTCTSSSSGCATFLDFVTSVDSGCGGASTCLQSAGDPCALVTSPCLDGVATGYVKARLPAGAPTCTPSAQTPTTVAASWQLQMLACKSTAALMEGGCAGGQVCSPALPADASLCIVRSGDVACPAGDYSERRLLYTSIEDSRGCTACNCAKDCSYGFKVFAAGDNTCAQAPVIPLTGIGMCVAVQPNNKTVQVGLQLGGTGACSASGGTATGAAQPAGPVTACCVP